MTANRLGGRPRKSGDRSWNDRGLFLVKSGESPSQVTSVEMFLDPFLQCWIGLAIFVFGVLLKARPLPIVVIHRRAITRIIAPVQSLKQILYCGLQCFFLVHLSTALPALHHSRAASGCGISERANPKMNITMAPETKSPRRGGFPARFAIVTGRPRRLLN